MINRNNSNPYDLFKIKEIKKCANDPIYFLENYMIIQHPIHGTISFDPYDSQRDLIHTYATNNLVIASLPRQTVGKSTCAAGFLLWKALFEPNFNILIGSHSAAGASEILGRIRIAYEHLPDFLQTIIIGLNGTNIVFSNGSRIIAQAVTERFSRGFSTSLIYLDEFAFVRQTVAKEAWRSICPVLSMGSSCIIVSTINGNEYEMFDEIWDEANKIYDEYDNIRPNGLGNNGFKAFTI